MNFLLLRIKYIKNVVQHTEKKMYYENQNILELLVSYRTERSCSQICADNLDMNITII